MEGLDPALHDTRVPHPHHRLMVAPLLFAGYLVWTLPAFVVRYWPVLRGWLGRH